MGIELPPYRFKFYAVHNQLKIWDVEHLEDALEAKIGNFADFKNIRLAITISCDEKYRGYRIYPCIRRPRV